MFRQTSPDPGIGLQVRIQNPPFLDFLRHLRRHFLLRLRLHLRLALARNLVHLALAVSAVHIPVRPVLAFLEGILVLLALAFLERNRVHLASAFLARNLVRPALAFLERILAVHILVHPALAVSAAHNPVT